MADTGSKISYVYTVDSSGNEVQHYLDDAEDDKAIAKETSRATSAETALSERITELETSSDSYVKKDVDDLANYYNKENSYSNTEVDEKIADFITADTDELINYRTIDSDNAYISEQLADYLKRDEYDAISKQILDELPEEGQEDILYLINETYGDSYAPFIYSADDNAFHPLMANFVATTDEANTYLDL